MKCKLTFVRNMRYLLNPVVQTCVTAFRLSVEFYNLRKQFNCADDECCIRHINNCFSIDFNNFILAIVFICMSFICLYFLCMCIYVLVCYCFYANALDYYYSYNARCYLLDLLRVVLRIGRRSPPCLLTECRKRRLIRGICFVVWVYCVVFGSLSFPVLFVLSSSSLFVCKLSRNKCFCQQVIFSTYSLM